MKHVRRILLALLVLIPVAIALDARGYWRDERPDPLLPEAHALALKALGDTNAFFCTGAALRWDPASCRWAGMPEGATGAVWRLDFTRTGASPGSLTNVVALVSAAAPPRIYSRIEAMIMERH